MNNSKLIAGIVIVLLMSVLPVSAYYQYEWGGAQTEPQSAIVASEPIDDDNLWAMYDQDISAGGGEDGLILEANLGGETCPDLTMTVPGTDIPAGTYEVFNSNGQMINRHSFVRIGSSGDYSKIEGGLGKIGEVVHDGTTDIIIEALGLPALPEQDVESAVTWLDFIRISEKIDAPAGKYLYTWGGTETDPTGISLTADLEWDDLWAYRTDYGSTLWGLEKSILEGHNPASAENCPDLTMTIPGTSVAAGTYNVYHSSGHPSFNSNVRIGTSGDFASGASDWSWDDSTPDYAVGAGDVSLVVGELVHDGISDIIIMASGLPGANGRTWLDSVMLDLTAGPPTETPLPTETAAEGWLLYY